MTLFYKEMESPVGKLKLVASANALVAVLWEQERPNRVKLANAETRSATADPDRDRAPTNENISPARETSSIFRLSRRGSEFQKKVWRALREIPFGQTRSYLDLAKSVGSAKAVRAVGAANGKNPLSIVVPCHRVIGANGSLTGFAGGLEVEGASSWLSKQAFVFPRAVRRKSRMSAPAPIRERSNRLGTGMRSSR